MTKEEIIDNLELYTVGRPKKDRVSITVEELQSLIDEIKVLEQQPTTQEILSHIETGITATGQSDSYCVGFCNALVWLKSCITHEEPQFFEDNKVSEISTGSTTTDDCVSRAEIKKIAKEMYLEVANMDLDVHTISDCISYTSSKCRQVLENKLQALPSVTPTIPSSEDCVSRQAVNDILGDSIHNDKDYYHALNLLGNLPPVTPTQSWIPIITREPTEEEKEDYFEQNGEELCYMIDSPMPDNGQEVLVSVGNTVGEDIFDEDFWNFEGWDIADVEAWMPMPLSYQGE